MDGSVVTAVSPLNIVVNTSQWLFVNPPAGPRDRDFALLLCRRIQQVVSIHLRANTGVINSISYGPVPFRCARAPAVVQFITVMKHQDSRSVKGLWVSSLCPYSNMCLCISSWWRVNSLVNFPQYMCVFDRCRDPAESCWSPCSRSAVTQCQWFSCQAFRNTG